MPHKHGNPLPRLRSALFRELLPGMCLCDLALPAAGLCQLLPLPYGWRRALLAAGLTLFFLPMTALWAPAWLENYPWGTRDPVETRRRRRPYRASMILRLAALTAACLLLSRLWQSDLAETRPKGYERNGVQALMEERAAGLPDPAVREIEAGSCRLIFREEAPAVSAELIGAQVFHRETGLAQAARVLAARFSLPEEELKAALSRTYPGFSDRRGLTERAAFRLYAGRIATRCQGTITLPDGRELPFLLTGQVETWYYLAPGQGILSADKARDWVEPVCCRVVCLGETP